MSLDRKKQKSQILESGSKMTFVDMITHLENIGESTEKM